MNSRHITKVTSKRIKHISLVLFIMIFFSFNANVSNLNNVVAYTQDDAYEAITEAFEVIEKASKQSIDVTNFVDSLNEAIDSYNSGAYNTAYNKAIAIIEEVNDTIASNRWDKVSAYILIPINIVLVAAIIVFFGRNIWGWYKKQQNEDFMDLEIIYDKEKESNQNQ